MGHDNPISIHGQGPTLAKMAVQGEEGHWPVPEGTILAPLWKRISAYILDTMVIMGVFARTVPQMQIFTMSFPVSFFIGMTIYISTITLIPSWLRDYYQDKAISFFETVYLLKP